MGFRFRKSVRLLPGIRLNFSTRGISTSLGGRGATVNIGRKGARATLGLPGTGLSYTTGLFGRSRRASHAQLPSAPPTGGATLAGWIVTLVLLLLVGSCIAALGSAAPEPTAPAQTVAAPAPAMRTVSGDGVNCRAMPVTGAVLAKLDQGTALAVVTQENGWTKLARMGGDCWVADSLLQ